MSNAIKPFKFRKRSTVPAIARELLRCFADPGRWTQGAGARDSNGRNVSASSHAAVCWCLDGATVLASGKPCGEPHEPYSTFMEAFGSALPGGNGDAVLFNDHVGLPAVRRVLRKLAKQRATRKLTPNGDAGRA